MLFKSTQGPRTWKEDRVGKDAERNLIHCVRYAKWCSLGEKWFVSTRAQQPLDVQVYMKELNLAPERAQQHINNSQK